MTDFAGIIDAAASHALTLGIFSRVNTFEAKNAPEDGLVAGIWVETLGPAEGRSGLASTAALLVLNVRIYSSMIQEPMDEIDPRVTAALDALITAYTGDFDLTSTVSFVDLLGMYGTPLAARNGYVSIQTKLYRVCDVTLPLIIDDAWNQVQ